MERLDPKLDVPFKLLLTRHPELLQEHAGAARDYAGQLARGDAYDDLTPTLLIVWIVAPLFRDLEQYHSIFELRERRMQRPTSRSTSCSSRSSACQSPRPTPTTKRCAGGAAFYLRSPMASWMLRHGSIPS